MINMRIYFNKVYISYRESLNSATIRHIITSYYRYVSEKSAVSPIRQNEIFNEATLTNMLKVLYDFEHSIF